MAGDAFTGGVKPGGLTSSTEVRNLLCYVIRRVSPLSREALENALVGEELVNYFELVGCLDDLIGRGLVTESENRYFITPRGEAVADTLYRDLPRSVRESAVRAVIRAQSWLRKSAQHKADVLRTDDGWKVHCFIEDMGSTVFELTLALPDETTAAMVQRRFIQQGGEVFALLLNTLTTPERDVF